MTILTNEQCETPTHEAKNVITIKAAHSLADLMEIYRYRYKIYHEEMKRPQKYADHSRKIICDPLDACATNFVAWQNDQIVGVVRVNLARDSQLGLYEELYGIAAYCDSPQTQAAIVTRLMIDPQKRGSTLAIDLAAACYQLGLLRDVRFNCIDCNSHLVGFFKRLGYREYRENCIHPELGETTPLVFHLDDMQYLEEIKSPLAHVVALHLAATALAA